MKQLLVTLCAVIFCAELWSQNIGINVDGSAPAPSALLDINGDALPNNGKRGLLIPRVTTTQRDLMLTAEGLLVYNTTTSCFNYWSIGSWYDLCGGQEKPRMIGYGGGVGNPARAVFPNTYQDIDVRIAYDATDLFVELPDQNLQHRNMLLDWSLASSMRSAVALDGLLYILVVAGIPNPNEWRVYRYDITDIASGGALMSFVGQPLSGTDFDMEMTANESGTFYFTYNAGNSLNDYSIARYNLTGASLIHSSSLNFGAGIGSFSRILSDVAGNVFGISGSGVVRKFNSLGGLLYTTPAYVVGFSTGRALSWLDTFYFGDSSVDRVLNRVYLE
jgi:hypothetical protein